MFRLPIEMLNDLLAYTQINDVTCKEIWDVMDKAIPSDGDIAHEFLFDCIDNDGPFSGKVIDQDDGVTIVDSSQFSNAISYAMSNSHDVKNYVYNNGKVFSLDENEYVEDLM